MAVGAGAGSVNISGADPIFFARMNRKTMVWPAALTTVVASALDMVETSVSSIVISFMPATTQS